MKKKWSRREEENREKKAKKKKERKGEQKKNLRAKEKWQKIIAWKGEKGEVKYFLKLID